MHRAAAWSASFDDPFSMAAALREAAVEYQSLSPEAYDARLTLVDCGDFVLQDAEDGAHLARGAIQRDRYVILLPTGERCDVRVNGFGAGSRDAVLFAPGAELFAYAPHRLGWAAIAFHAPAMLPDGDDGGLPSPGGYVHLPQILARLPGLGRLVAELGGLGREDPARLRARFTRELKWFTDMIDAFRGV